MIYGLVHHHGMNVQNQQLKTSQQELVQSLQTLSADLQTTNQQANGETRQKERLAACIHRVKQRAADFLRQHSIVEAGFPPSPNGES